MTEPNLTYLLEVYTIEELAELNDKTPEEILAYLIEQAVLVIPDIKPLE